MCFVGDDVKSICKIIFVTFVLFTTANLASANPVSFKDGWGIMPAYNGDWADLQVNYSLTNRYSIGLSEYYRKGEDSTANFGIGQFNYLLKRWNELESQANLYASFGLGGRNDSKDDGSFAGYGGLEADYETRRIYTLAAYETLQSASDVDFNRLRGRVGFSTHRAKIDELNTWIVAQIEYMPEMEDETVVTPLVRLFYNNFAVELGYSLNGSPFVGAMAHF